MASPAVSFTLSAPVYGGSALSVYQPLVQDTNGFYLPSTAANRALYGRTRAMCLDNFGSSANGFVRVQAIGAVDNGYNIGAGAADRWVRASATGAFEVFTPVNAGTSDIVGKADANGVVTLEPGIWTETMAAGGGGGIPAPSSPANGDLLIYSGGAWSRLPVGNTGQLLQVVSGLPAWVTQAADPVGVAGITGYWKDYAGSPWLGSVSVGNAGGQSMSSATPPTVGGSFGAHASAQFNGTTQSLTAPSLFWNSFISASSYFIECVFSVPSLGSVGGSAVTDPMLVADNFPGLYMGISASGLRAGHYDGVSYKATPFISVSTGTKHCAQWWYDGTNISLRLDGGTPVTVAAAPISFSLSAVQAKFGANYSTVFCACNIGRVLMAPTTLSSTTRDQLHQDAINNYGSL